MGAKGRNAPADSDRCAKERWRLRCGSPGPRGRAWGRLAVAAALGLPPVCAPAAAETTWRFAPERDYGPFVFERDGRIQGLSVDVLERVAQREGIRYRTLSPQPLADILAGARRGEVDLVSSLRPTPERAEFLLFTAAYAQVPAALVHREGGVGQLSGLAGRPVAVGRGYAVQAHVERLAPAVRWQPVSDDAQALRGVVQGRFDAAVLDLASLAYLRRSESLPGLVVGQAVGFDYALSFAVRRDLGELRDALDRGIRRLDEADRRHLRERWMPSHDAAALEPAAWAWPVVAAVLLLAAAAAIGLWRGRRSGVGA